MTNINNLTTEQQARLIEIAQEHTGLVAKHAREFFHMTDAEREAIKQRVDELRRERAAITGEDASI